MNYEELVNKIKEEAFKKGHGNVFNIPTDQIIQEIEQLSKKVRLETRNYDELVVSLIRYYEEVRFFRLMHWGSEFMGFGDKRFLSPLYTCVLVASDKVHFAVGSSTNRYLAVFKAILFAEMGGIEFNFPNI